MLRNAVAGVGLSAYEFLLAGDVAHILQTACVTGKVAVGEPEQDFSVLKSVDSLAINTDMIPNRILLSNALFILFSSEIMLVFRV